MTIQSLITDVRDILKDANAAYYTDMQIAKGVCDGFRRLNSMRPESRYVAGLLSDVNFPTAIADLLAFELHVEAKWRLGLVYFAAARCYETDIKDTVHQQLAATMFKQADAVFAL